MLFERAVYSLTTVWACTQKRSLESVVGMLAILKSGGAYLPLDPNYPADRLAFMVADSSPVAILATPERAASAAGLCASTIVLNDSFPELTHAPTVARLTSRNLAYVIYTSGSTGIPKGTMIEHRSVLRLAINPQLARLKQGDCVPHCASPSFDATTWEVWASLLNGASVLVVPQDVLMDPGALNRLLVEHAVTAMWLTAGLFAEYVDALEQAFGCLRYLLTGGDVVKPSTVARVLGKPRPPQHLINAYGPTEATTFATMFEVRAIENDSRPLPIGRPIANTQIHILDAQRRPVPIGMEGEIWISGPGVARGYINQPQLTAERFTADPFSAANDATMYRTGDLGRWSLDGNVEFLGRNDSQIKIRGFRVEPGEIEACLMAAPGIHEVVVAVREDGPGGNKRLVAYAATESGAPVSPAGLRDHVAARLPQYMVPHAYVLLDKLPLNTNGKVDRAALPAPTVAAIVQDYEPPCSGTETALARQWAETLGLSRVGRRDDFFELGGDSMLAMQLTTSVSAVFGIDFSFVEVFAHPTLLEMSAQIDAAAERATLRPFDQ